MSALLDSFATAFDRLEQRDAAGLGESRRIALDAAVRDGLPAPRSEAWKYTTLRALERRTFETAKPLPEGMTDLLAKRFADIPAPRLFFVDGHYDPRNSDLGGIPNGIETTALTEVLRTNKPHEIDALQRRYAGADEVFATVNAALAEDGVAIRVDHDVTIETVLHVVFVSTGTALEAAIHLRHVVDLGNDAALTLVEHHFTLGEHRGLCNHVADVHLGQRARLQHVRVQHEADGTTIIARTDAVLASAAEYRRVDLELGSALSRHELNVRLEGESAKLKANGVLFADGKRHLDTRLGIEHIARDTACDLLWRGLGAGRGRAVFHGGITIREGADGSDANLSSKNLLLSAQAEIDTQPVLVIHADEVKAAHGATVGQIDPTALFYLRSRGLPENEARALLTTAFCREALSLIDDAVLRERLQNTLDLALSGVLTT